MAFSLVRQVKKGRPHSTPHEVTSAITALSEQRINSTAEANARANQLQELGKIAYVIRALIIRSENGRITQADLDACGPPRVRSSAPGGTQELYDYLRAVFIDTRKLVTTLHLENVALHRKVTRIEETLSKETGITIEEINTTPSLPLGMAEFSQVLGELGESDELIPE